MTGSLRLHRTHFPVTVLGPGVRAGIWVQGCGIGCAGCMSRDTWDPAGGRDVPVVELLGWLGGLPPEATGVTVSGGEPFEQAEALAELLDGIAALSGERGTPLDVMVYSGFTLAALRRSPPRLALLERCDVVVTGPFVPGPAPGGSWRGSADQRLVVRTDLARRRFGAAADADGFRPGLQVVLEPRSCGATDATTTGWATRWICHACRASVGESAMVCPRCGLLLTTTGARIPDDRPVAAPSSVSSSAVPPHARSSGSPSAGADEDARPAGRGAGDDADAAAGTAGRRVCPNPDCRRPLPSANALICLSCMTDVPPPGVDRAAVTAGPAAGARPATAGRPVACVRLEFGGGSVRVDAGSEVVLGRHGTHGSATVLARHPDVSRRHARVRVGGDGTVRVRDGSSTNGTFVDGRRIGDGWVELPDGARLGLGIEVSATVRYERPRVRRTGSSGEWESSGDE